MYSARHHNFPKMRRAITLVQLILERWRLAWLWTSFIANSNSNLTSIDVCSGEIWRDDFYPIVSLAALLILVSCYGNKYKHRLRVCIILHTYELCYLCSLKLSFLFDLYCAKMNTMEEKETP